MKARIPCARDSNHGDSLAVELQFQCSLTQRSSSSSAEGNFYGVTGFARKYRFKDGILYISPSVEVRNCTLTDRAIECESTEAPPAREAVRRHKSGQQKMDRSTGETKFNEAYSGFSSDGLTEPDVRSNYSQRGVCKSI